MMMNTIFLGSLCPPKLFNECIEKKYLLDNPGLTLQNAILEGLKENTNLIATISLPLVLSKKKLIIKSEKYKTKYCNDNYSISYINIPIIKQVSTLLFSYKCKRKIQNRPDLIFIYSIGPYNIKVAKYIKTKYPSSKVIMLVTDLPQYMRNKQSTLYKFLKSLEIKIINKYIHIVDGYVLLSKYMKECLPMGNKPYMVMEGIYINSQKEELTVKKESYKTIFYTGNLNRRYGLMELLEAFSQIKSLDYRLWIRGQGSTLDEIKKCQLTDNRIIVFDYMPRDELLLLQRKATILVNPVFPSQEFSKYYFPSKTMEYLASGTPTVMFKLACIPEEYYRHIYFFKEESIEGIRNTLESICSKSQAELDNFGNAASLFIKKNKTPSCQIKRIIDFVKTL